MKPREFIVRIVDLFDFNLGPNWKNARPRDLTSAHLQISLGLKTPGFDDIRQIINSYLFVLESATDLGVCTIRASMVPVTASLGEIQPLNQPLLEGLRATLCFVADDASNVLNAEVATKDEQLFEFWHLPKEHEEKTEDILGMITYLTLKTNYRI